MDFVSGLPLTSRKNNVIWVIVNRLMKSTNFIPFKKGMKFNEMTKLFVKEIIQLHATLISIVSDRDTRFVSSFCQSFQQSMRTKLSFSTAYHPQIDGQSEHTI